MEESDFNDHSERKIPGRYSCSIEKGDKIWPNCIQGASGPDQTPICTLLRTDPYCPA